VTDIFKDLPRLKWRGIEMPVAERRVGFEQELARHKFAYRDDELIESLGRHNWRFEYTIPFREDIDKGPYRNLYVSTFSTFLQACRDRSEGQLEDPILGQYTARVESLNIQTDINRRDGEDVQVVFVHSPALDEVEATGATVSGLPGRQIVDELGVDIFDQIGRIGTQISVYADRIDATLAAYEYKIDKVIDKFTALDKALNNPQNMPLIRSALRAKDAVERARYRSATQGKTIVTQVTDHDSSVTALANYLGMSIKDLLLLNPKLPTPLVPSGSTVFYYQRA
jgi:hypothetical protein